MDQSLFEEQDGNTISFTLKRYPNKRGLSDVIFRDNGSDTYEMQGPMGKGLEIQRKGVHIAYTAGTGVLVFVDLVAHLIRKNLGMLNQEEDGQLDNKRFKFILYVSFAKKEDSIALDLCKGLTNICKSTGKENFELHVRLSVNKPKKWDTE